jgi:hypothetical protein
VRLTALVTIAAAVLCAALLVAGCGGGDSGGSGTTAPPAGGGAQKKATAPNAPAGSKVVACGQGLRATAVDCGTARRIMRRWDNHRSCALPEGASRGSCALGSFRCQTVKTGDGTAVSCAHPGGDIAFIRPGD